jgi:cytochrome P450
MCVLLFNAGHETTVNLIGNGVLRHPDELEKFKRAAMAKGELPAARRH